MKNKFINLIAFFGFLIIIAAIPMDVLAQVDIRSGALNEDAATIIMMVEAGVMDVESAQELVDSGGFTDESKKQQVQAAINKVKDGVTDPDEGIVVAQTTPKPTHEHKYSIKLTKDPTCNEEGILTYTCECGNKYEETTPKLEHNYIFTVTKEPTCTTDGEKTFKCSLCGDTYTEVINETGHKDGQFVITKEPTCTEKGERIVYCKVCQVEIRTEEIEATGHENTVTLKKEPTNLGELAVSFFAPGYYREEVTCMKCQEVLETHVTPVPMWHYVLVGGIGGSIFLGVLISIVKKFRKRVKK